MSFQEFYASQGKELLEYFERREREFLKFTRALVETESPSGYAKGIRAVVSLLADQARKIDGVTSVELVEGEQYGAHLRVRAFGGADDSEQILIIGHTDTVHELGSWKSLWREAEGRVYGPGIFDMKANCALAVEALRACSVLNFRPRRPVLLLLTCDEEIGSVRGRPLIEEEAKRSAYALVLEPPATGGRVKTERKGTGIFTLEAKGHAAHAGLEPEKGASAVLEIARQIERLHSMNDLERGTTVNVGTVEGGSRVNVVAAEARAEIDVRFGTAAEAERIAQAIRSLKPYDERVQLIIGGGINRPPLERSTGVVELYQQAKHVASVLDYELGEARVGGASDGNFVAAIGTPVLDGLGIDGDGAHAAHEHIKTREIAQRGALLAGLITTL
ncbi:MAG TPA: M20 family metallopeptidase [Pyrinomonadaceae bacterium]|nr:M20 family metallopeptidase [Pyrinomonadaceae bacterium]